MRYRKRKVVTETRIPLPTSELLQLVSRTRAVSPRSITIVINRPYVRRSVSGESGSTTMIAI